jgi:quercetin dioxygenase-like cupin family protein
MSYPLPTPTHKLADLPIEKIVEAGGFYFRSYLMPQAGTIIPQHVHDHDHVTLVGSGRVRGWANGECIGERGPGEVFDIWAGSAHVFQSLEPNSLLVCVHDVESALSVKQKGL